MALSLNNLFAHIVLCRVAKTLCDGQEFKFSLVNLELLNQGEKANLDYSMQIFFPQNHIYLAADEKGEKMVFFPFSL